MLKSRLHAGVCVIKMSRMLKLAGFEECGKVDVLKIAEPFINFNRAP